MYTVRNFKTKKLLKLAVQAWNDFQTDPEKWKAENQLDGIGGRYGQPDPVTYYQPGPFGGNEPKDGTIYCEGPHYPEPHRWYAQCEVKDGVIVRVK